MLRRHGARTHAGRGLLVAVALSGLALGLTACGDDDATATGDPTTGLTPRATTGGVAPGATITGAPSSPGRPETPRPAPTDYPGPSGIPRSEADTKYLAALKAEGLTTAGVEDQVIGAGNAICKAKAEGADPAVYADATAGQLVGQGKSTKSAEEVSGILREVAEAKYCP